MVSGVYQIVNIKNGKCYVGSSAYIKSRWRNHNQHIKNKTHSQKLQNAFNKHSVESFEFLILEECNEEELLIREQYWIDWLDSYTNGYNTQKEAKSRLGIKTPDSVKKKISLAKKGTVPWNKGKSFSDETKRKMQLNCHRPTFWKGKKLSDEHRQKISLSNKSGWTPERRAAQAERMRQMRRNRKYR